MQAINPGIQTMPSDLSESTAGIRLVRNETRTYGATAYFEAAPRASAVSIRPLCDSTSARKRLRVSELAFMAL
jgi:hypothetical protein